MLRTPRVLISSPRTYSVINYNTLPFWLLKIRRKWKRYVINRDEWRNAEFKRQKEKKRKSDLFDPFFRRFHI